MVKVEREKRAAVGSDFKPGFKVRIDGYKPRNIRAHNAIAAKAVRKETEF